MPLQGKKQVPLPAWPIYISSHTSFLCQDIPDDGQIFTSVLPVAALSRSNPLPPPPTTPVSILMRRRYKHWKERSFRFSRFIPSFCEWSNTPHWPHLEGVHADFRSIRLLPVRTLPRVSACVLFFCCEVKNPSRTNALRRKAVLPLGAPHSLLEQSIKKNKAFKQWITTDRSIRRHKQEAQYELGIDLSYKKSQKYKYSPSGIQYISPAPSVERVIFVQRLHTVVWTVFI